MKCDRKIMELYAVTDREWVGKQTLYEQVESALKGGVTCVQLREKEITDEEFLQEAIEIKKLCRMYDVPLIINDNVNVAIKCKADGVHVGQEDMNSTDVRRLVGDSMIIGVSVHTIKEAVDAVLNGADYLGVGAVFSTSTKLDVSVLSNSMLKNICRAVDIPVVAIGGINKENIQKLKGTGIDGIALVSAIFSSDDIEKTCIELREIFLKKAKMNIEAAIFDVDGTLLDSMGIWDTLGTDYLRSLGKEPEENLREKLKTMSLQEAADFYKNEYNISLSKTEIINGVNNMLENFYYNEALLKDGVAEFLKELSESGIKLCIATATDKHLINKALERCDILKYFTEIITCTEVGHGKSEPDIYRVALEHLDVDKKKTLVFEDAVHAIKTANADDFITVGVYDCHECEQEEIKRVSDFYMENFLGSNSFLKFAARM